MFDSKVPCGISFGVPPAARLVPEHRQNFAGKILISISSK